MPRFADVPATLRALERWLLPPACLCCDDPVPAADGDALVCGVCRSRWRRVPTPLCLRCGQPRFRDLDCRICEAWPAGLARVRSAVWLDGAARLAVHRLKYDGWPRIADAMVIAMRDLEPLTAGVNLIPVPLGAKRQRRRGYNQSEALADALARAGGFEVRRDLLRRRRETATQTALTPEGRIANVADAFVSADVAGRRVVLVDDVFTTGATLVAAASALASAGAVSVEAVTFARATPPV